jgi:hypothetical protein
MSNFKIGEKVVCINAFKGICDKQKSLGVNPPIKGEIYTIRCIDVDGYLTFEELINPKVNYRNGFLEATFNPDKFRKLDYAHTERICAEIIESLKVEELQYN